MEVLWYSCCDPDAFVSCVVLKVLGPWIRVNAMVCNVPIRWIRFVFVSRGLLSVERRKKRVRDRRREMLWELRKQHYQRRASKTISYVSWVICDPAFFQLQRAAVCWNTASGSEAARGGAGLGRGGNLISLINADTRPV